MTSHAEIEEAAFRLFADRGFDDTTLEAIAAEVGVGRRTLFRYYRSKNDIPWGQFDRTLDGFRDILAATPTDVPLHRAVGLGVIAFNDFPADASPSHAERMRLILETPTLQAHSVIRYAEWREVISDFAAERLVSAPTALEPQLIGQVALALALTAYGQWLAEPGSDVMATIERAMAALEAYLGAG